ncbi:MAG: hypothetical protein EDQ89_10340 [Acidobacteria bacterium]|nr:MAG: hypothetical protein EDQ89_10340 [Acidobacteriota bacterium]GIK76514.1 MAG: hypothetical protein BroJett022_02040 [Actinomycetes bacterium]
MPPLARPYPRFIADSAQEPRPYGRWEERLTEAFAARCAGLAAEAGTGPDLGSIRYFPERTWGGRTFVPAVAPGAAAVDGAMPEFFGHVSFHRADGGEPEEMVAAADFTDVTAEANPDWQVDLNDDVIGRWRADGGRGGDITLIWGTPLVRGALAATAELDGEVVDQAGVSDGRFTLVAVDAVHGFGDDHFLEVRLWNRKLQEVACESLYADDEDGEAGAG